MIEELTGNNIPPSKCTITKAYENSTLCDIKTDHGTYKRVNASQQATVDDTGVLVFLDGDMSKPYVLVNGQGGGATAVIATGSFSINNQGHLIVELPNAVDNPYFINNQGHLIYDTSNTHNGGLIG